MKNWLYLPLLLISGSLPVGSPDFINPTGIYLLKGEVKNNKIIGHSGELRVRLLDSITVAICLYLSKGYPGISVESRHGGFVGFRRRLARLETRRRRAHTHDCADRLLRRRRRFPDRDVDRIPRRDGRFLGLDAGERNLGSGAGRDHYLRLAHDRRLGTGPSRRHQPDHLRLGDRDDSACRAQCRLGRRGSRGRGALLTASCTE